MRELLSHFYAQPDSDSLELLLVVEEVHRFLPKFTKDAPGEITLFLDRAVRELRKKGVGTVFISQVLTDFRASIRANTATKILMRTSYDGDIDRATKDMGRAYSKHLSKLKTGQGVVSFADFGKPFFVQFRPPLHSPKGMRGNEISEEMQSLKARKDIKEMLQPPKAEEIPEATELGKIRQRLDAIPEDKVEALKSLVPEVYDVIRELKGLPVPEKEKAEPGLPDEDLFLQKIREFTEKQGVPPRIVDVKLQLGWGDKKTTDAVKALVKGGRVKKVEDERDRRAKRLIVVSS
jgi:hypothetical protein